jgi:polar amino acid transport system permease protein
MHRWDFGPVWAHADLLLLGLWHTLQVTGTALAFGIPLGLALALMRLSPRRLLRWPAGAVIEVFRTTPPLVQLFWFFFALPILIDVEMTPFVAAALTFSIQSAAFFAEVFRGGIVSVERGQWEAGRALGMTPRQVMRRVVLPQAVKRMLPAFLERAIELMKTTTLVATISYADLLFQANEVAQKTFRPLEVFTVAALLYFVVIYGASLLAQAFERRLAVSGEGHERDPARAEMGAIGGTSGPCGRTPTCCCAAPSARCACLPSAPWPGLLLGLLIGLARQSPRGWLRWPATAFVEFFRNTPVLVQILWFYFALPILAPFEISPLAAAALGISLNSAAFTAEIVRGGIASIDRGQWEAARALGMTGRAGHAPHRAAAGAAAHAAGADQPRHRDLQDEHAGLGGGLCRTAAAGQAAGVAEFQPHRDLHGDRGDLLPVPAAAGAGHLLAGTAPGAG